MLSPKLSNFKRTKKKYIDNFIICITYILQLPIIICSLSFKKKFYYNYDIHRYIENNKQKGSQKLYFSQLQSQSYKNATDPDNYFPSQNEKKNP